ncbi:MAG: 16S rRNA (guanine(966)-N(2))-methyltransferase RsmD [Lachnospiraceae bacterium]|nr:16S rRNA (guanine(966)-N(2))-methyltransferase RsmD [Lachnospiraceae bacterium]
MRVIAGSRRSLPLKTPKSMETRPTTDRIKETLFNMLQSEIPGSRFLDLFSGSGGIGIEALSRGAESAVFVENSREAVSVIEENLRFTRFTEQAVLLKKDVFLAIDELERKGVSFDVVFLDPPYRQGLESAVLKRLSYSPIIGPETLIVAEMSVETDLSELTDGPYTLIKDKKYKTNRHVFLKRSSA